MTNSADDRILEYLDETDFAPPKEIAEAIGFHPEYTGERCRVLRDGGLLFNLGRGLYRITDLGEQYLSGDLDARTLEEVEGEADEQE